MPLTSLEFRNNYLEHSSKLSNIVSLKRFVHTAVVVNPATAIAQVCEGREGLVDLSEGDGQGPEHRVRVRPFWGSL